MKNTIIWDKLRILVTNGCNYRCPFCHNEGQTSKDRFNVMNLDNFKLLIDYLKDEEISEITFSGGEPFLNPNLIEMIKYVSERTNWEVSCASNLSLVTKERIQQLANIPLKFNIQFPFIDASKFQKSTGSSNLSRVMENIRLVRESGLEVGLNSVIQSDSKEDVKEMVEFALKEELPLKLLPQIGLPGSSDFKQFIFPILREYAVSYSDKGTGAIRWLLEKGNHRTSVLYIDSPCFSHDIKRCRNYSEIRILPDFSLQPCILRESETVKLDFTKEKECIKQQFRELWKNLKSC